MFIKRSCYKDADRTVDSRDFGGGDTETALDSLTAGQRGFLEWVFKPVVSSIQTSVATNNDGGESLPPILQSVGQSGLQHNGDLVCRRRDN